MDPLKSIIVHERVQRAIGVGLLIAFLAVFFLVLAPYYSNNGQVVDATVVRIGTYPVGSGYGGELPILTLRLRDGSIRQVQASWQSAANCLPGSSVSLLQRGTSLQVGLRGCDGRHYR